VGDGEGEGEFSKRIKRRTEEQREGAAIFFYKRCDNDHGCGTAVFKKKRTIFFYFFLKGKR
jgi:hypothetical protein